MDLLQIVQSYFAAINIKMEIRVMDYGSWNSFVKTKSIQDALTVWSTGSEVGTSNEPLTQWTSLLSYRAANYLYTNGPVIDDAYAKALDAKTVDEVKQVVKDVNEHIARQHMFTSLLQPMTFSLIQLWLKGYNGQNGALSGNYGVPFLDFYTARFWIDQGVKNSFGY